jgi:site-specific recombinase XerC
LPRESRFKPKQHAELKAWRKGHRWHPHQLRHTAATEIRRAFGLEAAQVTFGHSLAQVTDAVYAERDQTRVAGSCGVWGEARPMERLGSWASLPPTPDHLQM